MHPISPLTYKVVAYQSVPGYNMDECVDWAVEMIELGHNTEHLLMLAGLTKPVNYFETKTYLEAAIGELGLKLKAEDDGIISYSSYYITQIANGVNIRENLKTVSNYVINADYHTSVYDFFSLHWAWDDLEWNDEQQSYWPGATSDNIEHMVIDQAKQWLVSNEAIYSQFTDDDTGEVEATPQLAVEDVSMIDAIKNKLQHYAELVIDLQDENKLIIETNQKDGFAVGLVTLGHEYRLYFDDYYMHYDTGDEDEILQLIVYALTGMLRLEVHSKNGHDYKWVLQQKDADDQWQNKGTTAIFNLRFWIKPEIRYLQNSCVFKR
jgi:hypothetical protein